MTWESAGDEERTEDEWRLAGYTGIPVRIDFARSGRGPVRKDFLEAERSCSSSSSLRLLIVEPALLLLHWTKELPGLAVPWEAFPEAQPLLDET